MMIKVSRKCPMCGIVTYFYLDAEKLERWQNGELIQNVFPELSPENREVLISGICYECQKKIFG